MGCNSKYRKQIEPVNFLKLSLFLIICEAIFNFCDKNQDVIIVDIDQGNVFVPTQAFINEFPLYALSDLKTTLLQIDINLLETKKLTTIIPNQIENYRKLEKDINNKLNIQISNAFLEFYVNIFGDVYSSILIQANGTFNKKKYVESKSEKFQKFFEQVLYAQNLIIEIDHS
jgi:hypothetical protein